jgi:hypothetical protein
MTPSTKAGLIAGIESERERLNDVLERVPPERMDEPNAIGAWSVKDALAHLAVWSSRAITMLFQAEHGGKPIPPSALFKTSDWTVINAADYAEQKSRPLDLILGDFDGTHEQLLLRLEAWQDEAALFDPQRYASLNGNALASYVWGDSGEHDAEHRADIEAWLK